MKKAAASVSFPVKLIILLVSAVAILMMDFDSQAAKPPKKLYLPLIVNPGCGMDGVINGGFEQDDYGWSLYSTGMGNKTHDLIGSVSEGFSPYRGLYAARLGGYEGVWDAISQTVAIPAGGYLTYWWKMGTYETLPHHDALFVSLLEPDGTSVATLAYHDDQDIKNTWQQEVIDVSGYAGNRYILQLLSTNDNYYFSWFDVDEVHLCGSNT